jgi:hypothetical protein
MIIIDLLAIAGVTLIITTSKLFRPVRELMAKASAFLGSLSGCAMCMGVWIGLGYYFVPESAKEVIQYASIGSLVSQLIYLVFKRLDIR